MESILSRMFASPPRVSVAVGMVILAFGFLSPLRSDILDSNFGFIVVTFALMMIIFGLVMDVYLYLRSSPPRFFSMPERYGSREELELVRGDIEALKNQSEELLTYRGKVLLSADDIAEVKTKTVESLGNDVLEKIAAKVRAEVIDYSKSEEAIRIVSLVSEGIKSSQRRLAEEVESLGRRANVNLTIGFAVSLVGMIALSIFIWTASSELDGTVNIVQVLVRFLTKLSLVVFMQVFAYFFLRLYRYSLFEIKYFQNELTNIEQKYIALNVAMQSGNKDAVAKITAELSKAERNFILKKGETTVGLRREEIEARYEAAVADKAESLIDKIGSVMKTKG